MLNQNYIKYINVLAIVLAVLMVLNFVLFVFGLVSALTFWLFTFIFGFMAYKGIPYLKQKK